MKELEKTARELILAITEKTLKTLHDKGILKEPSKLQMLCSSPEMKSLIKKLSAPKYDPCRKFRKGDIVEIDTHGRDIADSMKKAGLVLSKRYAVTEDEGSAGHDIGYVSFIGNDGIEHHSMFFWLKLVTPVEEIEPYNVYFEGRFVHVKKGEQVIVSFNLNAHPHAKEAANAECDRLNAEYRKEQDNG